MFYLTTGAVEIKREAELSVSGADLLAARLRVNEPQHVLALEEDFLLLSLLFLLTGCGPEASLRFSGNWSRNYYGKLGRLFVIPDHQAADLTSSCGEQRFVQCRLSSKMFQRAAGCEIGWSEERLAASLDITNAGISSIMLRLGTEIVSPGFASELMCEGLVLELAVELARYYRSNAEDAQQRGALSSMRLRLIDERLEDLANPPSLAELARLCELSIRQVTRGFRLARGISIGEYMGEKRFAEAQRRLLAQESIKSVAFAVGFRSSSSFCQTFRKSTGQTPGEFREFAMREVRH